MFSQVVLSELQEGDHVYTWRKHGLYSHHGIFIGDGKIINFVQTNKNPIRVFSSKSALQLILSLLRAHSDDISDIFIGDDKIINFMQTCMDPILAFSSESSDDISGSFVGDGKIINFVQTNKNPILAFSSESLDDISGIFIGDDKIINFVQTYMNPILAFSSESSDDISGSEKTPCNESYCGSEKVPRSGVRMSCIACFVRKSSLYRYKYNVSNMFLITKVRAGTCTTASSDPPEQVMHRVNYLYENGYGEYDLRNNNCEDFALYCKTGLWSTDKNHQGRSSQRYKIDKLTDVIKVLGGSIDVSLVPRLAMAVAKSIKRRKKNDLGNRKDVVKIDVEKLSSYISSLK